MELNRAQLLVHDDANLNKFRTDHGIPADVSVNFVRTVLAVDTLIREMELPFSVEDLLHVYTMVRLKRESGSPLLKGNHYLLLKNPRQPQTRLVIGNPNKDLFLDEFVWVLDFNDQFKCRSKECKAPSKPSTTGRSLGRAVLRSGTPSAQKVLETSTTGTFHKLKLGKKASSQARRATLLSESSDTQTSNIQTTSPSLHSSSWEVEIAHSFREGCDTDASSSEIKMGRFRTLGQKKSAPAIVTPAIAAPHIIQVPLPTPDPVSALSTPAEIEPKPPERLSHLGTDEGVVHQDQEERDASNATVSGARGKVTTIQEQLNKSLEQLGELEKFASGPVYERVYNQGIDQASDNYDGQLANLCPGIFQDVEPGFNEEEVLEEEAAEMPAEIPDVVGELLRDRGSSGERRSSSKGRRNSLPLAFQMLGGSTVDGNPDLCLSVSCKPTKKEKNQNTVALIVSVVSTVVFLSAIAILWSLWRRRRAALKPNGVGRTLKSKNRRFSYSEVVSITNNFERVIGKGGFGTVYLGHLEDGTEVAVKMLSLSSTQGSEQFWTEAELLTTIHHRNLASLIGYCDEASNTALVYEYMANGNLQECLLDKNRAVLTWEQRLQIAVDAAHALEYLHNGCKPPIIHRDIKTANILLDDKLQAKVADFGLSRIFPIEDGDHGTHVTTVVMGTLGYLDPEYYITRRLTKKSDVYSFGVVLLELITGQPAIIKSKDSTHIVQWVMAMLERGEISNIADPRLEGEFDSNSMWKALEAAIACVPSNSLQRPTMSEVVGELNECLEMGIASGRDLEMTEISQDYIKQWNRFFDQHAGCWFFDELSTGTVDVLERKEDAF
ncbi:FLG22-induced receptor-like kinase 1 [Actinidia rufa]|uniref:FLG22-induced receptor-like kinase 1 n=1 Tax=Actinidia rufa TaxID=165716 RepID=A0A7J0FEI9_9ERIC|nr:FLG22-induced receptor-like kinase 1 [Actinidia rufa]